MILACHVMMFPFKKRLRNVSNKSTKSFIVNLVGLIVEYGWNTRYKMMHVIAIIAASFLRINSMPMTLLPTQVLIIGRTHGKVLS